MSNPVVHRRSIPCEIGQVGLVRQWVTALLQAAGFPPDAVDDVRLALSEAITNILVHAGSAQPIELEVHVSPAGVLFILRDFGQPFDGGTAAQPDADALPEGGYGLFLIQQTMDRVEYLPMDPGTEVRMWKALPQPS